MHQKVGTGCNTDARQQTSSICIQVADGIRARACSNPERDVRHSVWLWAISPVCVWQSCRGDIRSQTVEINPEKANCSSITSTAVHDAETAEVWVQCGVLAGAAISVMHMLHLHIRKYLKSSYSSIKDDSDFQCTWSSQVFLSMSRNCRKSEMKLRQTFWCRCWRPWFSMDGQQNAKDVQRQSESTGNHRDESTVIDCIILKGDGPDLQSTAAKYAVTNTCWTHGNWEMQEQSMRHPVLRLSNQCPNVQMSHLFREETEELQRANDWTWHPWMTLADCSNWSFQWQSEECLVIVDY